MPGSTALLFTDEALDRIASQWFEDVRVDQAKASGSKSRVDAASYSTFIDRLFDTDDGDAAGDSADD
ncbi:hypothetical protein FV232_04760 [Methylobacterium sp. WL30]|uniref:hypothetical protein n=1 Tax=unclassified Methylobacterium TaxID=2615210 RepID=UPI0011CA9315|nr:MULTISPECIES: hypothetical protein [unclassified Methylobacterium]TXN41563.1 hypothetical protein FV225_02170 [Methylobacterium sp. WL93]TXN52428.1 hypothetical protein FV227_03010 [Methylobacterium sp. WL119]TXN69767.1 hypothetical protein FV232_04760 [Methylobacterium sp. WL30]